MLVNPKMYEINTRVWIKQFGENATLADVPDEYYKTLAGKGIDVIWLMGIWRTCPDIVEQCCFSSDLVSSYSKALSGWQKADVVGSPYSIDTYEINPLLGTQKDLLKTKELLNSLGVKLVLDFIPNHFGAGTRYLSSHPEIFLQADEESLQKDSFTFFRHDQKVFAHGRDPLFPAWTDTVQVNMFNPAARAFLTQMMVDVSELCDGFRCDMAMLPMNNVFHNTWIGINTKTNAQKPQNEFWKQAIEKVRNVKKDFIFIAEVYWGLEWELQQLGFDFTYDKRLMERLHSGDTIGIRAHLMAEKPFQQKSVRFIENHDEQRAVAVFGKMRSLAAATIITTITGMKLYYDGQFSGRRIKLPVQLRRQPEERVSQTVKKYYDKLLEITKGEIFRCGIWQLLEASAVDNPSLLCDQILTWQWSYEKTVVLVAVNYYDATSQCRIKFTPLTNKKNLVLTDRLTDISYNRSVSEMGSIGLFVELKAYSSHIFFTEL